MNAGVAEQGREYYMGEGGGFPRVQAVATLALARNQGKGVARVRAKRKPESHIKTPGSARKCGEWTLTLPRQLPCWELVRVGVPKGLPKLQSAF